MENPSVITLKSSDASKSGEQLKMSSPTSTPELETERKEPLNEDGSGTANETVGQVATRIIQETVQSSSSNQDRLKKIIDATNDKLNAYVKPDKCQDLTSPEGQIDRSLELMNSVADDMEEGVRSILDLKQNHQQLLFGACGVAQEDMEESESVVDISSPDRQSNLEIEPRTSRRVRKSGGSYSCTGCMRTIWGTKEAMEHQSMCKVKDAKIRSTVFPHEFVTDVVEDDKESVNDVAFISD